MMDAFIALPYLIYSPGRRLGMCRWEGLRQEQFEDGTNELAPSF